MKKLLASFLIALFLPTVASAAILDNIKASWNTNEVSGDAADSAGGGFTATISGITYGAGKILNAMIGDGSSNADPAGLDSYLPAGSWTVAGWVNATSHTTLGKFLTFTQGDLVLYQDTAGKINCQGYDGAGKLTTSTTALTDGTWYFVACTSNGTTETLYINGTSENTHAIGTLVRENPQTNLKFFSNDAGTQKFTGKLDDWTIWDRALSGAEITTLYNSGTGLEYPFSGGAATPTTPNPFILITFF